MIYDGLLSGAQQCVFHVIVIGRKKYKNNFKKKHFVTFFFFCFASVFQKDPFCIPKGLVLHPKRTPFAG